MILDSLQAQALVALLGGVAAEVLHWYALSRKPGGFEEFRGGGVYWVTTAGMILLGGVMPVLYIEGSASAALCFHLGAATPIVVQKLVANAPTGAVALGASESSLREFFRW